jgi:hypothetical protein
VLAQQAEAMAQPGNLLAPAYNALGATQFNQLSLAQQQAAAQQIGQPAVSGPGNAGQQTGNLSAAIAAPNTTAPSGPPPQHLVQYIGGPLNGQWLPG